ncbi:hypothetical protein J437_LFUL012827 [Ladona fulva]|uniref:Uncharacterized protein n=1 Tax=Ladona fulva TaxID=123851 RepID=A0A8K0P771_LADFU|nr:hypothetical protein J437_LFUL012827 [Ladona fulva]
MPNTPEGVRVTITNELPTPSQLLIVLSDDNINFPSQYPTSCLLGYVDVLDCLSQEDYRLQHPQGRSLSPYVLVCDNPHPLPIYFPIQGNHKIYKLDSKIHLAAQKSLQRIAKLQAEKMAEEFI